MNKKPLEISDTDATIIQSYKGIRIDYDEDRNKWKFELRGREREVDSLKAARQLIDQPMRDKATFQRFKAWFSQWRGSFVEVEVTSIAVRDVYNTTEVWISKPGEGRSKELARHVYPKSAHNDHLISGIHDLDASITKLTKSREELVNKLKSYEPGDE